MSAWLALLAMEVPEQGRSPAHLSGRRLPGRLREVVAPRQHIQRRLASCGRRRAQGGRVGGLEAQQRPRCGRPRQLAPRGGAWQACMQAGRGIAPGTGFN